MAVLGLWCIALGFLSSDEFALVVVCGLLIMVVVVCGFSSCGLSTGSVVVAHRFSCSAACGILPDQGSNPYLSCIGRRILYH